MLCAMFQLYTDLFKNFNVFTQEILYPSIIWEIYPQQFSFLIVHINFSILKTTRHILQSRIQSPVKHLRWGFSWERLTH